MSDFKAKNRFRIGLRLRPHWELAALRADTLAVFNGPTSKRKREGRRR